MEKQKLTLDFSRGWYRQGDVAFIPIVDNPVVREMLATARPRPSGIVLEGEVTGHAHRMGGRAAVLEYEDALFVDAPEECPVIHEDHDAEGAGFQTKVGEVTGLPAGLWLIQRQRELTMDEVRLVQD